MDSMRNAMGYDTQSGQEPLSGQTGQGTANEPYDSGNVAGQSGAPSYGATSTNPTGTSQFDTGTDTKGNTSGFGSGNDNTSSSRYRTGDNSNNTNTSENLAPGVTSDSYGPADTPADNQPLQTTSVGDTSGAAGKGTDETRGDDEQVTSEQSRPTNDNNANAQDTFFANAGMSKDKPADPPKVASEVADKDPFASSGGPSSNDTPNEPSGQSLAPTSSNTTSGAVGGSSTDNISSTAPDKNYISADTEPHPQSSEVLSSATPGAALDSQPISQSRGYDDSTPGMTGASGYGNDSTSGALGGSVHDDNTISSTTGGSGYGNDPAVSRSDYDDSTPAMTGASGYGNDSTSGALGGSVRDDNKISSTAGGSGYGNDPAVSSSGYDNSTPAMAGASGYGNDSGALGGSVHDDNTISSTTGGSGYGNDPAVSSSGYDNTPSTNTTTTAAAADTDYPSPKTQPSESAGGLAGVSHNTGSAPSAPDTGVSDSSLQQAASHGADDTHQGEGKMKMSDKIKEKLHMGKK